MNNFTKAETKRIRCHVHTIRTYVCVSDTFFSASLEYISTTRRTGYERVSGGGTAGAVVRIAFSTGRSFTSFRYSSVDGSNLTPTSVTAASK